MKYKNRGFEILCSFLFHKWEKYGIIKEEKEGKKMSRTYKEILLDPSPIEFADWVIKNFTLEIPETIESVEDLSQVSKLIANTANKISYISNLLSYMKVLQRDAKRSGSKTVNEDCIDKKEVLSNTLDTLVIQHRALSRMITVRQEITTELKISDSI